MRISEALFTPMSFINPCSGKYFPIVDCPTEAMESHSHGICCDVSTSAPYFLHVGESTTPIWV